MNIGNLFFNKQVAKPQVAAPQANNKPVVDNIYANEGGELNWDDEIFQKLYPNKGFMG